MRIISFHKLFIHLSKFISLLGIIIIIWLIYYLSSNALTIDDNESHTDKFSNDISNSKYEVSIIESIFEGVTNSLACYTIKADKTFKVAENKYNLEKINVNYLLNGSELLIHALNGCIDDTSKMITISDTVQVESNDYILTTEKLDVNLKNEEAVSNSTTRVNYKNSEIRADSFYMKDKSIVNFNGHVVARIKISDF